jgi:hypothetical protein
MEKTKREQVKNTRAMHTLPKNPSSKTLKTLDGFQQEGWEKRRRRFGAFCDLGTSLEELGWREIFGSHPQTQNLKKKMMMIWSIL